MVSQTSSKSGFKITSKRIAYEPPDLDLVNVGVEAKHRLEGVGEGALVELVGILSDSMDQLRPLPVLIEFSSMIAGRWYVGTSDSILGCIRQGSIMELDYRLSWFSGLPTEHFHIRRMLTSSSQ